jgi:hypothetical protein
VTRGILDNWKIAHLMNFYSGRYVSPGINIQEANTTNNMSNLNAIFTGSPNYGPRIGTTGNPNNGGTDMGHMFDQVDVRRAGHRTWTGIPQLPALSRHALE